MKGKDKAMKGTEKEKDKEKAKSVLPAVEKAPLTSAQKAAIVVVSLGADKASLLYQHMDEEDVEALTVEIARLGFVDGETTEEVLTEFYQMCVMNKAVTEGGLEYARSVLEAAYGEKTALALLDRVARVLRNRKFSFMNKAEEKDLYTVLQNERPQTISLVLSYIEPAKAAAVIEQLSERVQIKVVENIAQMTAASPTAVKIIENEMSMRFANIFNAGSVRMGGIDFVASIMNNLDRKSEKSILEELSSYDKPLADEIRKRMFIFEDIITLDDTAVQRFLRDCDTKDIVLALKAANADVAEKLFANMSARVAESIRDDMEITTNIRLKDAQEAQQRVVGIIRKLEEEGEIFINKGGKESLLV